MLSYPDSFHTNADPGYTLAAAIEAGSAALGLSFDARRLDVLARYLKLLAKWNLVYNLTGIRDAPAMVAPHLLDSLSAQTFVRGARVLDVGSGAGLPGIPLAIANADQQFVLLDSNAKKTRFMQQVKIELGLVNVRVERMRIESYRPEAGFDTVICRAFAGLTDFVATASHACLPTGCMLAMKAGLSVGEEQRIRAMCRRVNISKLAVPGIEGERQVVEIFKT